MSNSPLIDITIPSPNHYNGRSHIIDRITIHHMSGKISARTCGEIFARSSRQASSNYGIDSDGVIALYVDEENAPWTSSSYSNDNRAVTIEVANNQNGGNWSISDIAMSRLIDLVTDICKRNNIKELNFTGDTSGNVTFHCWFANTDCPGTYLKDKIPNYIVPEVNKRLAEPEVKPRKVYVPGSCYKTNKKLTCWNSPYSTGKAHIYDKLPQAVRDVTYKGLRGIAKVKKGTMVIVDAVREIDGVTWVHCEHAFWLKAQGRDRGAKKGKIYL